MRIEFLIVSVFLGFAASQECDTSTGWQEHAGKCLRVSRSAPETQFTWHEARAQCMSEGGDLASIHSQEEQAFVINLALGIGLTGAKLWTGMSQLESKTGPFSWTDSSTVDYNDWSANEPRTSGLTQCGFTLTEETPTGSFVRYDYYETTSGILDPDLGHVPQMADGVNTFYFGGGYSYDRTWCEYMCSLNERCAAYSWYGYHYNYNWEYQCVGRSDLYDILVYDSYTYSGVRTLGTPGGWWMTGNCGLNHAFVCKKEIGSDTPVTIPPTVPIESYCPEGYFSADGHNGNKCYRMYRVEAEAQGVRWEQALLFCRNGPGVNPDLASIHSMEENAIITAHLQEYGVGYWIGVHYAEAHDKWVWADNVEPVYYNWAAGRPAGSGQCGELWAITGPPGTWTNTECDTGRGFICQTYKDADNIIATPPPEEPTSCPEGWFSYWYSCYQISTEPRTWADAKTYCEGLAPNASLVSVHTASENSAVFLGAGTSFPIWLGLHKESPEDDTYKWTDNWPTYYANFDEGGTEYGQGCVVMKDNAKWNDTTCTSTHAAMCKLTNVSSPDVPPPGEGGCPTGNWIQWGGRCYFFSSETDNFINAISKCQMLAGSSHTATLVSINNAAENQFVYTNLAASSIRTYGWIGFRFDPNSAEFVWLDGSDNSYKNWSPGQPENPYQQPCAEMDVYQLGRWNDWTCDSTSYNYYICESELGPEATYPPVPTSAPGECPSIEWVKSDTNCYLVRPTQDLHWHAALDVCKALTGGLGSLTSIRDQEENQFIYYWADYLTPEYETPMSWIGLHKQGLGYLYLLENGTPVSYLNPGEPNDLDSNQNYGYRRFPHYARYPYVWEDGTPVEYLNWAPGEPNDIDGTQNCVRMYTTHGDAAFIARWDDYYCSDYYNLGYVCRTELGVYSHLDQVAIDKEVQKIIDEAHRQQKLNNNTMSVNKDPHQEVEHSAEHVKEDKNVDKIVQKVIDKMVPEKYQHLAKDSKHGKNDVLPYIHDLFDGGDVEKHDTNAQHILPGEHHRPGVDFINEDLMKEELPEKYKHLENFFKKTDGEFQFGNIREMQEFAHNQADSGDTTEKNNDQTAGIILGSLAGVMMISMLVAAVYYGRKRKGVTPNTGGVSLATVDIETTQF